MWITDMSYKWSHVLGRVNFSGSEAKSAGLRPTVNDYKSVQSTGPKRVVAKWLGRPFGMGGFMLRGGFGSLLPACGVRTQKRLPKALGLEDAASSLHASAKTRLQTGPCLRSQNCLARPASSATAHAALADGYRMPLGPI
jgi:hypothetical protein